MEANPDKPPQRKANTPSSLNAAINALGLARDRASVKQAEDAFSSTSVLLIAIRVRVLPLFIGFGL
jgi:hypothetical protein